jgi:hypothetical protein
MTPVLSDRREERDREVERKGAKKKDTRKSPQKGRNSSVWKSYPFIPNKSVYERKRNWLRPS